ncbi:MAG: hypothetical protein ACK5MF_11660 [Vibrio sp.]
MERKRTKLLTPLNVHLPTSYHRELLYDPKVTTHRPEIGRGFTVGEE